jgi:hypothetical protein
MILRMTAAILLALAATSTTVAQRRAQAPGAPKLPFPAEKFSTRPVQGYESRVLPAGSEKDHKQRWEERSNKPSRAPK